MKKDFKFYEDFFQLLLIAITPYFHLILFSCSFFMILVFSVMTLCFPQMLKWKAQLVNNNKSQLVSPAGEWLGNGAVGSDVVFLRIN